MPKWLLFVLISTIAGGIFPIFNNKNAQVLGPNITIVLYTFLFSIFGIAWLIFHPRDLLKVDANSFFIATIATALNLISLFFLYSAYQLEPSKLSVIRIVLSFSVIVLIVINHFLGQKLLPYQWLGAVLALFGIVLVNWKK